MLSDLSPLATIGAGVLGAVGFFALGVIAVGVLGPYSPVAMLFMIAQAATFWGSVIWAAVKYFTSKKG